MENGLEHALEQQERRRKRYLLSFIGIAVLNLSAVGFSVWSFFDTANSLFIIPMIIGLVGLTLSALGIFAWSRRTPEGNNG